jgi:predicted hydrocarbon binding protein
MDPIPKSGYFYANKIVLLALKAFEEVMGKNGVNAILNLAHLPHLIEHYPPDNLHREFDFSDFSAINLALEEMYGPRGGRGLALRAGRAAFADALRNFGALAGVGDLAFKVLPLSAKMRIGIPAMARIFSQISDQYSTAHEREKDYLYVIHRCPVCWGRSGSDKPVCFIAAGLLQGGLKWLSGGFEFRVQEAKCVAMGNEACEFIIDKTPMS